MSDEGKTFTFDIVINPELYEDLKPICGLDPLLELCRIIAVEGWANTFEADSIRVTFPRKVFHDLFGSFLPKIDA